MDICIHSGFVRAVLDVNPSISVPHSGSLVKEASPTHTLQASARGLRTRSTSDLSVASRLTPTISTSLASPALTPAIFPMTPLSPTTLKAAFNSKDHIAAASLSDAGGKGGPTSQKDGISSPALQPPSVVGPFTAGGTSTPMPHISHRLTPGAGLKDGGTDYFSVKTQKAGAPLETDSGVASQTVAPLTPGGKLIGRFRNIGKNVKRPASAEDVSSPTLEPPDHDATTHTGPSVSYQT